MRENDKRDAQEERSRCQIGHVRGKPRASCSEPAKEDVDGLLLCEGHALEAKLEGQIECWGEMLFHIDLWSGEAIRQDRTQIVELLDVERAQARGAIERAYEDLDTLRRSDMRGGEMSSGGGEISRRGSLPLPPKAVRPLSGGLRRQLRR